jgi:hypothetical protein
MMLIASFSELIGPPLANARFRGQRRKLFLKAENGRIRQRAEGQAWREQPRIQFALVFASVAGASVWPSISAPASRKRMCAIHQSCQGPDVPYPTFPRSDPSSSGPLKLVSMMPPYFRKFNPGLLGLVELAKSHGGEDV